MKAFRCNGCREFKDGEPMSTFIKTDVMLKDKNNNRHGFMYDFETIREYCDECTNWIDTHQPPPKYARGTTKGEDPNYSYVDNGSPTLGVHRNLKPRKVKKGTNGIHH